MDITRAQQQSWADLITVWRIGMGLEIGRDGAFDLSVMASLEAPFSVDFQWVLFSMLTQVISLGNNMYVFVEKIVSEASDIFTHR